MSEDPPGADAASASAVIRQLSGGVHSYEVQLVLEFCDQGCLRDALDAGAFFTAAGVLNLPGILDTACDVARAMVHLHACSIVHGDLKAANVMLKSGGADGRGATAKVVDFGLSVRMDSAATHVSSMFQGTLSHMAPEVLMEGRLSKAADVYAFAITLHELFTAGHAYTGACVLRHSARSCLWLLMSCVDGLMTHQGDI
jgi:serine/threonine protein kinase